MYTMTSKILKFVVFLVEITKFRYLENETLFFLKKIINHTSRATLWQKNNFAVEVTFIQRKIAKYFFCIPLFLKKP